MDYFMTSDSQAAQSRQQSASKADPGRVLQAQPFHMSDRQPKHPKIYGIVPFCLAVFGRVQRAYPERA